MYHQNYEDYMRSVLGYAPMNQGLECTYQTDPAMYYPMPANYDMPMQTTSEYMESMYPEIYKIVYPMVKKVCEHHKGKMTPELLENMTMEIFDEVEADLEPQNRSTTNTNLDTKRTSKPEEKRVNSENRNRNFVLKDLIQILILRELLSGNRPPRPRPPFSGGPGPRPPFPGGPFQPRMYSEELY